jgi:hypothetical protein
MVDLTGALKQDVPQIPGSEFYRRPLFRNWYSLGNGALAVLAIVLSVGNVVRFWEQLSFFTIIWFGIVVAWILKLWFQAFRYHRGLRDLYKGGGFSGTGSGASLESALSVAASMTNSALFCASFLVDVLLILFAAAMRGRV